MQKINLPSAIFALSALIAMAIGFWTRASLPIPRESGRLLGMLVFLSGMTLFTWASVYLKQAFFGNIEPLTEQIVTDGPYRWMRHPLYLSMLIALIGFNLALRSGWGMVGVLVLFLPSVVNRARLEDQAMQKKFGSSWQEFAGRTFFLLPPIW
ncbi:MAG: isoprenylcysteine carboxylmethyltransferase family protein [Anaerolineales bacterium]